MNYLGLRSSSGAGVAPEREGASPFEAQAFFIRTKGAGNMDSWPDVLTIQEVVSDEEGVEGEKQKSRARPKGKGRIKFHLRRDKPCCYVSTESWAVTERTTFELCDEGDVWLICVLAQAERDGRKTWTLECRMGEEEDPSLDTPPRWGMHIEVSLVGKCSDCPCFLSQTTHTTRRINNNRNAPRSAAAIANGGKPLVAIEEENELVAPATPKHSELSEGVPVPTHSVLLTERFEETYKALGGKGSLVDGAEVGENGDITWFNAGLRIGVGVGLGVCLGAGLGAGILLRSYQYTANSLKRRLLS